MKASVRSAVGIVGVALLLGAGCYLYARFVGRSRLRFPYLGTPLSAAQKEQLLSKPGWSATELEVAPGVRLQGLVRRPAAPGAAWLLYYPGNSATQLQTGQRFLSALARDSGWGLAVFAYRGFDSSEGKSEVTAMGADAPQILRGLCAAERVAASRVHVIGFSIGGYYAVRAVAASAAQGTPPASLTLLASVYDIVMVRPSPWQKLSLGDEYKAAPFLPGVPAPVLVLQGTSDEALLGPAQGRAFAQALGERAKYEELAGVRHEALLKNEQALDSTRKFVRDHGG